MNETKSKYTTVAVYYCILIRRGGGYATEHDHDHDTLEFDPWSMVKKFDHGHSKIVDHMTMTPGRRPNGKKS